MSENLEDLTEEVTTSPYQFELRFQMDWQMTLRHENRGENINSCDL